MFDETTIFYVVIWSHPTEPIKNDCLGYQVGIMYTWVGFVVGIELASRVATIRFADPKSQALRDFLGESLQVQSCQQNQNGVNS